MSAIEQSAYEHALVAAPKRSGTLSALADLVRVLSLERFERDLFRGESRDIGTPQVFGGQVLAQGLTAAYATVEHRHVHSLHAYFLRRGDVNAPIVYRVERIRDGASFSMRRVSATQHGEQLLTLFASFQIDETGFDHQIDMPSVPSPESIEDAAVLMSSNNLSERIAQMFCHEKPFEFRFVQSPLQGESAERTPIQQFWFRAAGPLPEDASLHRCLLTYVSDYHLLITATGPHGAVYGSQAPVIASIDHALWFHRPVRVDEWLLYSMESPSASGARGFARACIYTREGRLVASTAQEGLIRAQPTRSGVAM